MAEPRFEKDLAKLEKIVAELEEGGLSLDDSLKRFEEGIKLARRCEKALAEVEQKIEVLTKNAQGELVAEPFGEDAQGAGNTTEGTSGAQAEAPQEAPEEEDGEEGDLLF